jgi:hypothetical protein
MTSRKESVFVTKLSTFPSITGGTGGTASVAPTVGAGGTITLVSGAGGAVGYGWSPTDDWCQYQLRICKKNFDCVDSPEMKVVYSVAYKALAMTMITGNQDTLSCVDILSTCVYMSWCIGKRFMNMGMGVDGKLALKLGVADQKDNPLNASRSVPLRQETVHQLLDEFFNYDLRIVEDFSLEE